MPQISSISSSDLFRLGLRLARLAPIAVLLLVTNLLVDPDTGTRRGTIEQLAVEQILSGRAVRRSTNERLFHTIYLEKARSEVQVLVLGSSRSMPVSTGTLGGLTLWNCSFAGALLEELTVMYLKADRSRLAPKTVLLSLDLRHFQPMAFERRRLLRGFFGAEFERAGREFGVALIPAPERAFLRAMWALESFSPGNFQRALPRGVQRVWQGTFYPQLSDVVAAPGEASQLIVRRTDGSLSFPRRPVTAPELEAPGPKTVSPSAAVATELDGVGMRLLEALIARVRADGRRMFLLMPPYRHDYAPRMRLQEQFAQAERELRLRAKSWGVPLLGSFDPAASGCGFEEFRDATHPTERCLERLLTGAPELSAGSR